jgi:hypothetical protein
MMLHRTLLVPAVALVVWTFVMWAWMYATRIPAIFAMKLRLDSKAPRGEQMATLPPEVRWKADNYNHLFEQPTLFYPTAIILALVSNNPSLDASIAWAYVVLRVIHSVFQATVNKIQIRFGIFTLSSLVLIALTVRAVIALM